MPSRAPEHFKTYTVRTQVKHWILKDYLEGYLTALRRTVEAIHYIDGFAGRGVYGENQPGSPLLALEILARQPIPAYASFVEQEQDNFENLEAVVGKHALSAASAVSVRMIHGSFEDHIEDVLGGEPYSKYQRVATFAFVDPCAIRGVRMRDLARLLDRSYSEVLLLWNYDGLNRWLGLIAKQERPLGELQEFFGDPLIGQRALEIVRSSESPEGKEVGLLDLFIASLRAWSGAQYFVPMRFEADAAERTSHYLVHCSRHPLAFRLMKEVMGKAAMRTSDTGTFMCLGAKERGQTLDLFAPHLDSARQAILRQVAAGATRVDTFTEQWAERPDDPIPGTTYKKLLLELEAAGEIVVLDPGSGRKVAACDRRKHRGKPTLAGHYEVALALPTS